MKDMNCPGMHYCFVLVSTFVGYEWLSLHATDSYDSCACTVISVSISLKKTIIKF